MTSAYKGENESGPSALYNNTYCHGAQQNYYYVVAQLALRLEPLLVMAMHRHDIYNYVKPGNKNQILGTHIGFQINMVKLNF